MKWKFDWSLFDDTPEVRIPVSFRQRRKSRKIARELISGKGPRFASHYVVEFDSLWKRHLAAVRGRPRVRGLDVGTGDGRAAAWLLQNILTDPTSRLDCVDGWEDREIEQRFDHNAEVLQLGERLRKRRGRLADMRRDLAPESFDFCHIRTTIEELTDAWPLLQPGGVLLVDGPDPALIGWSDLALPAAEAELLEEGEGFVVVRKRG
jgi:SAM-dependent methyltransferase